MLGWWFRLITTDFYIKIKPLFKSVYYQMAVTLSHFLHVLFLCCLLAPPLLWPSSISLLGFGFLLYPNLRQAKALLIVHKWEQNIFTIYSNPQRVTKVCRLLKVAFPTESLDSSEKCSSTARALFQWATGYRHTKATVDIFESLCSSGSRKCNEAKKTSWTWRPRVLMSIRQKIMMMIMIISFLQNFINLFFFI